MAKQPMNPLAGPAGPGPFSTRTDQLRMGSTSYGEGVETQAIKSGAPLAKTSDVRGMPASQVRRTVERGTPLYAPTERPNEPITTGAPIGPGAGPEALGINQTPAPEDDTNFRATMLSYMPVLSYISSLPNTSPETRRAIRQLRDSL